MTINAFRVEYRESRVEISRVPRVEKIQFYQTDIHFTAGAWGLGEKMRGFGGRYVKETYKYCFYPSEKHGAIYLVHGSAVTVYLKEVESI